MYRLAGMCVDKKRAEVLEDISTFAFQSGGRQLNPKRLEVVVWLIERWPWVRKNLSDLVLKKEEINKQLGALQHG